MPFLYIYILSSDIAELISSESFCIDYLRFSILAIMSSTNSGNFLFLYNLCLFLKKTVFVVLLHWLEFQTLCWMRVVESGYPYIISNLGGETFGLSPLSIILPVEFLEPLINWRSSFLVLFFQQFLLWMGGEFCPIISL